ncbi:MAG TPA: hypothetical protein VGR37_19965 [Longimicrobiaceae bacterium]|nr:hypothetical protein [Longimicrobiaceae bacterium]
MTRELPPAADRVPDILDVALRALELLDQAVGRAARLPPRDRDRVREHLLAPRNHLRSTTDALRRKLEREAEVRTAMRT